MRIVFSGGGTGGHIYPALTILRKLQELHPEVEVLYIGTDKGLESDIIPKENIPFRTIRVSGFRRSLTIENLRIAWQAAASVCDAFAILKEFAPQVVVGTGGYVCGPVLLAAKLAGIPTMIQEQNVVPGMTNRILARLVNQVAVGYEDAVAQFPISCHPAVCGNPVRPEVLSATREAGLESLGLDGTLPVLLVSGGSRGARSINQAMLAVHQFFAAAGNLQIVHVTGRQDYDTVVEGLAQAGISHGLGTRLQVHPYLYDMANALAAADIAVFRAGAIALAELTVRGIPGILIPYPYAAANHQEWNARSVAQAGAAVVIDDASLSGASLTAAVQELLSDAKKRNEMKENSLRMSRPEAAADLAKIAWSLGRR
ncbi:undecaprenyldiphospho-muramoylpentapeptide beta-N-acetylglucosaminyltransferase [Azotosporobacter soli]|uniref:undecaprenyldiphospho-muramoylpentapeptide beta-N-acetylglucosaminyltransferase n=1 Tax=Azotosporobacter soli TaxID=3055040 RepID=UPI0031FE836E